MLQLFVVFMLRAWIRYSRARSNVYESLEEELRSIIQFLWWIQPRNHYSDEGRTARAQKEYCSVRWLVSSKNNNSKRCIIAPIGVPQPSSIFVYFPRGDESQDLWNIVCEGDELTFCPREGVAQTITLETCQLESVYHRQRNMI